MASIDSTSQRMWVHFVMHNVRIKQVLLLKASLHPRLFQTWDRVTWPVGDKRRVIHYLLKMFQFAGPR
jgi:hypothetical protein